ncbi:Kinesin light chain 3 [Rhizophlyctis rosea]|nr:Kinesin light chain 3 [Rhizophlyctis rosea]
MSEVEVDMIGSAGLDVAGSGDSSSSVAPKKTITATTTEEVCGSDGDNIAATTQEPAELVRAPSIAESQGKVSDEFWYNLTKAVEARMAGAKTRTISARVGTPADGAGDGSTQTQSPNRYSYPLLGVRPSFIHIFIQQCGGRSQFENLTTAEVCERFIKPHTALTKSFCDHLLDHDNPAVGPATFLLSHTWQYKFLDIADAASKFFTDRDRANKNQLPYEWGKSYNQNRVHPYVWIDLFSLPQHFRQTIEPEWLKTTFTNAISSMGNVVMVLYPWDRPITLTRAWCVFELYACIKSNSQFHITLPPSQTESMKALIEDNPQSIYQTIAAMKSEDSDATVSADLDAIQTAIRQTVGFAALNTTILDIFFNWLIEYVKTLPMYTAYYKDPIRHMRWRSALVDLCLHHGNEDEARTFTMYCLQSMDYDRPAGQAGKVLNKPESDLDRKLSFHPVPQRYELGSPFRKYVYTDEQWADLMARDERKWGSLRKQQEKDRLQWVEECRRVHGKDHPDVLATALYVATKLQTDVEVEEGMLLDILTRQRRSHGMDNPWAIRALADVGDHYYRRKMYREAMRIYTECVERKVWNKEKGGDKADVGERQSVETRGAEGAVQVEGGQSEATTTGANTLSPLTLTEDQGMDDSAVVSEVVKAPLEMRRAHDHGQEEDEKIVISSQEVVRFTAMSNEEGREVEESLEEQVGDTAPVACASSLNKDETKMAQREAHIHVAANSSTNEPHHSPSEPHMEDPMQASAAAGLVVPHSEGRKSIEHPKGKKKSKCALM